MANDHAGLLMLAFFLAACALAMPVRAGTQINRAMKLEPGGRFVLETFAGTVNIMGSNESGADVAITSTRDDIQRDVDFDFEQNPGEVDIKAVRRDPWSFFFGGFGGGWLHYDIRVPKNTQVVIRTSGGGIKAFALAGDTELRTSGGSIEASQVTGNLRASSSGGNIHAQAIHGDAQLTTSGGGIEADAVDGALRAYTSGGWIRINGVAGRVDAHTSGGSINAVFNKGDSNGGSLSTSGGWIAVKIDPAADLDLEASTSGGAVQSDLPIHRSDDWPNDDRWHRKTHLRGTLGSGGDTLQMHTSGGSIRISAL